MPAAIMIALLAQIVLLVFDPVVLEHMIAAIILDLVIAVYPHPEQRAL